MVLRVIASATPSVVHAASDIAMATGADEDFIRNKVGISERRVLGDDETGVGLAAQAVLGLLRKADLSASDIDLLVFVTQNPDRRIPHNAPMLAEAVGLRKDCASFDISLGCSGFVYGLSIVEAMLSAHGFEHAVLVTCDPYSRIMAAEDKATNAVFGDAAAACWVSREGPGGRLHAVDFGTDGSGGDAIRIDKGGAAYPLVSVTGAAEGAETFDRDALRLHMSGRDVFNFVNKQIPQSISASLDKAGASLDAVDYFALHQGSLYMLQALARRAGIPEDKLLSNIDRYGNTVSSSIPLLLEDLMRDDRHLGSRVLVSGFGVGLSWATGLIDFDG